MKITKASSWCPYEDDEQIVFVRAAKIAYPFLAKVIAAVLNGGYRNKREAAKLKRMGGLAGYPDVLIDYPSGAYHGLRVEMKRRLRSRVTDDQKKIHKALRANGYAVVVARGAEVSLGYLKLYLSLKEGETNEELNNAD